MNRPHESIGLLHGGFNLVEKDEDAILSYIAELEALRTKLALAKRYDFQPGDECGYNCGAAMVESASGDYILTSDIEP